MQGILTSQVGLVVFRKIAEFCIGISPKRVQRVLYGIPDGRCRGNRVPNNHESLTSTPMAKCLQFLLRKYHFDAEGLPDRFSVEGRDATTLTIGTAGSRNRIAMSARSALCHGDEANRSAHDIREEEERPLLV